MSPSIRHPGLRVRDCSGGTGWGSTSTSPSSLCLPFKCQRATTALRQAKHLLLPRHIRAPEPKVKKKRPGQVSGVNFSMGTTTYACLPCPPSANDLGGSPPRPRRKPLCCGGPPKDWLRRQSTSSQRSLFNENNEHTPAGMKVSAMLTPPAGVTRGKLMPTAGWQRNASYMTAWR